MRGIVKRFPGVLANDHVDFDLLPGEIHVLLGENGAGKTTLMNILYGLYRPEAGEVWLRGQPVHFRSAFDAIAHGLGMVHQHFMLVNTFTVAENMTLGQPSPRAPLLERPRDVHGRIVEISERYGLQVDPAAVVWQLSVGEQQRVEILKALYRGAGVLILDEPTGVLTPQEVNELLSILRSLAEQGKSVVFISHKLNEVMAASDRITVLRDGRVVGTVPTSETNEHALARLMVGRDVALTVDKEPSPPGEARLQVEDLWVDNDRELPALRGLSLQVRAGEILGLAGVAGNGQSELEEAVAGLRRVKQGRVLIDGADLTNAPTRSIITAGLGHIPSDRYAMGMLPDFTVAENLVLSVHGDPPYTRRGMLDRTAIVARAERLARLFDVRTPSIQTRAGSLSGGNIQKMILARELSGQPKVLIAAQPTRGLDVSAIEFVHRQLLAQRQAGVAILLVSTELDEVLALSDRIAVMYEGRIVGVMPGAEVDVGRIGLLMAGRGQPEASP
ncbi:MAG TPA: heme ABC transporter ATP-binding protein [Chloroflexi bacterium]|nr:heme ABC transporter ATP-binding protein [Chloroflexota bacterium]